VKIRDQKPDWQKSSDYPPANEKNRRRWAWEFLRRNPEYQADYIKIQSHPLLKGNLSEREIKKFPECFVFDPPLKKRENFKEWAKRIKNGKKKGKIKLLRKKLSEKYKLGIPFLPNPLDPLCRQARLGDDMPGYQVLFRGPYSISTGIINDLGEVEAHHSVIKFDLRDPIKKILQTAERELNRTKSHLLKEKIIVENKKADKRFELEKLQFFLRIWDARSINIGHDEIADKLSADVEKVKNIKEEFHEQTSRNWLRSANKIVEKRYYFLSIS